MSIIYNDKYIVFHLILMVIMVKNWVATKKIENLVAQIKINNFFGNLPNLNMINKCALSNLTQIDDKILMFNRYILIILIRIF